MIALREQLLADGRAIGMLHNVTQGQFQTMQDGKLVFYVENITDNKQLQNIFIASQPMATHSNSKTVEIITATKANITQINNNNDFYLVLRDGKRYSGAPGAADYSIISFAEYGRELLHKSAPLPNFHRLRATAQLINSNEQGDIAELQWRLAMPFAVMVLAILAVPLAKVSPRESRYAKFLPGIVLYICYYNALTLVRRWLADGTLQTELSFWGVHLTFLLIAIILLANVSGRTSQLCYIIKNFYKK